MDHRFELRSWIARGSVIVAAGAAFACSAAADDDNGTAEQEKRIKPNGNEDYTHGTVTVKVPAGSPTLADTQLDIGGVAARLGQTVSIPVGQVAITIGTGPYKYEYGSVDVKGGKSHVITLSVLAPITYTPTTKPSPSLKLAYDFGPEYVLWNQGVYDQGAALRFLDANGEAHWPYATPIGTGEGIVLVPSTKYEIVRAGAVASSFQVGAGAQIYSRPPLNQEWRAPSAMNVPKTKIELTLDKSDFPLAYAPTLSWHCAYTQDAAANAYVNAGDGAITFGQVGRKATAQTKSGFAGTLGCSYVLAYGGGAIPIDPAKATNAIDLYYLDVEHVHVTHTNGSTRDVPGKYRLLKQVGPGQAPVAYPPSFTWATETAIPVDAGTYVVEVQYEDNATTKVYRETVTVP